MLTSGTLLPVVARIQVPRRGFPSRPRSLPRPRSVEESLWYVHASYKRLQSSNSSKGQVPAIAMFASFSRYKREAFRHSQFAPKVLNDAGIPVIMKVGHQARMTQPDASTFRRAIIPDRISLVAPRGSASLLLRPSRGCCPIFRHFHPRTDAGIGP
jgi:hypothetical protein